MNVGIFREEDKNIKFVSHLSLQKNLILRQIEY